MRNFGWPKGGILPRRNNNKTKQKKDSWGCHSAWACALIDLFGLQNLFKLRKARMGRTEERRE